MFTNELSAKQSKLLSFFFSFLFPPKKIQRCCAGGGSVQDGSNPSSPPGPGPPIPHAVPHSAPPHGAPLCARSHISPGPARPQQRSRTAELPAAPASRARPVPLSGTARHGSLPRSRCRLQPQLRSADRTAPPRCGAALGRAELCRTEPGRFSTGAPLPAPLLLPRPGTGALSEPRPCPMSRFYFQISETISP